jgi:anti-sigma factor RsiW
MHDTDNDRVIVEREQVPVVVERRRSVWAIVAGLIVAAVIIFAAWLFLVADDETRDAIIPDDVDVSIQN